MLVVEIHHVLPKGYQLFRAACNVLVKSASVQSAYLIVVSIRNPMTMAKQCIATYYRQRDRDRYLSYKYLCFRSIRMKLVLPVFLIKQAIPISLRLIAVKTKVVYPPHPNPTWSSHPSSRACWCSALYQWLFRLEITLKKGLRVIVSAQEIWYITLPFLTFVGRVITYHIPLLHNSTSVLSHLLTNHFSQPLYNSAVIVPNVAPGVAILPFTGQGPISHSLYAFLTDSLMTTV